MILNDGEEVGRVPLHNFSSIISFGHRGVSPALAGACAFKGIDLVFVSPSGRFLARISGPEYGNVVLRKTQYQYSLQNEKSLLIAKSFILGKIYNSRWILERAVRDHKLRIHAEAVKEASIALQGKMREVKSCFDSASLRGLEGQAGKIYFSVFDEMILQNKETFLFHGRSRRPPMDPVNALLSFSYSLLANMCTNALYMTGLDPYVGFLHTDRPGRLSLSLDLMEEFRGVFCDRFVLFLINNQIISEDHFDYRENGAVLLNEKGRTIFITEWQKRKQKEIKHPFLEEKVEWGMVPYSQALLLTRFLRGDLDSYPPFFWK